MTQNNAQRTPRATLALALAIGLVVIATFLFTRSPAPQPTHTKSTSPAEVAASSPAPGTDNPHPNPRALSGAYEPPPAPAIGTPDSEIVTVITSVFSDHVLNAVGQVFGLQDLDRPPRILGQQASPVYPAGMKRQGISGEVALEFIVDSNGDVRNVIVKNSSHREFEAPSIEAIQQWKFRPGGKDGENVATKMTIPIMFTLKDD